MNHDALIYLVKTVGLAWLMGLFLIVVVRAYNPARRAAHEAAARSILRDEGPRHE